MGIDAFTQDERGNSIRELLDPKSLVTRLVADAYGPVCLRFLDPYGDTYFNQLQIPVLLEELESAVRACRNSEARAHGEALLALVASAVDEVHTYVLFSGD